MDVFIGLEETKVSLKLGVVYFEVLGNVGVEVNIRYFVKWKNVDFGLVCGGDSKNLWLILFLD